MTAALSRLNFRDLGGLPAGDGCRTRSGLVYRSEGPASFTDEHAPELDALGFRTVCDLRSEGERESAPHRWCGPDCRVLALDLNHDLRAQGGDIWDTLRADASGANARQVMVENSGHMPGALLPHWRALVDALLGGETPLMIHCTAGKDRTGVAVALLLALVGVGEADILADYGRSDVFARNMRMVGSIDESFMDSFGFVPSPAAIEFLVGVHPDFLRAALDAVAAEWGSVAGYFMAAGVGPAEQARLRAMLLEPVGGE